MAKSQLHEAVAAIAGERGAMVISRLLFHDAVLNSIQRAAAFGSAYPVLFPTGNVLVAGRYKAMSIDPATLTAELGLDTNGAMVVQVGPGFEIVVELLYVLDISATAPDLTNVFSEIRFQVPLLDLPVTGNDHLIKIGSATTPITARVDAAPTRQAAINASGISTEDLLRVEGSIAYIAGSKLVSSAMGELQPIDLAHLFPALSFGGKLEMHNVRGALLAIPERFSIIGNPGCPLEDPTKGVTITPQVPQRDGDTSNKFGVNANLPALSKRVISSNDGVAATYLPKKLLDVHFGKVAPAVSYRDNDNGFIGYDVQITAAIRDATITVDVQQKGLLLSLGFAAWGLLTANVDVPCVGRMDLAQIKFELPNNNGTATIEALVRPAIDTGGRLLLTSELTKCDLGEARVDVQLFSKYLGIAGGKAAVIGFILDGVIGRIIAHNLPGLIALAIKNTVQDHFFVLADLGDLAKYQTRMPNTPSFSGDSDSALLGLLWTG